MWSHHNLSPKSVLRSASLLYSLKSYSVLVAKLVACRRDMFTWGEGVQEEMVCHQQRPAYHNWERRNGISVIVPVQSIAIIPSMLPLSRAPIHQLQGSLAPHDASWPIVVRSHLIWSIYELPGFASFLYMGPEIALNIADHRVPEGEYEECGHRLSLLRHRAHHVSNVAVLEDM